MKLEELYWSYFPNSSGGGQKTLSFRCECGKTYPRYTSLWNHKRYRCGKLPQFSCGFCDHRTWHKCNLKTHMAAKHADKMESADTNKTDIAVQRMDAFKAKLNSIMSSQNSFSTPPPSQCQTSQASLPLSSSLPSNIPPLPPGLTISFPSLQPSPSSLPSFPNLSTLQNPSSQENLTSALPFCEVVENSSTQSTSEAFSPLI
ncbi:homeotic protein spalt-major-like [Homalodisca vitripennis]|uniref:homeotic protein spalt-major-like n=1 Tax=Homalodisca vitripennis TaxID=197043 RepID=UPI001EEB71EC|nr:homeotic protein spalt-major-like [Homalodisca vitripennis]